MLKVVKSTLVFACCIYLSKTQAPYPPNGYRPEGRQFELPRNFGDNSNLQPENQYGTPTPSNEYVPGSPFPGSRLNQLERQQNDLQLQSQYGTPKQNPPPHQFGDNSNFQPETQYGTPTIKPPSNEYVPGNRFSGSRLNQFERQQNDLQLQTQYGSPKQNSPPQQYLPSDPSSEGKFNDIQGQHQPNLPSSQGGLNNFERHQNNFRESAQLQIKNLNENSRTEVRGSRQNYLSPNPTKRTRQRGYPEQTTRRPRKQEEPTEEQESNNPNVAVSTAVANGQYYLFQPNGVLQRLTSNENQQEGSKSNGFTAKLVYQNLSPLSTPFYTPIIAI